MQANNNAAVAPIGNDFQIDKQKPITPPAQQQYQVGSVEKQTGLSSSKEEIKEMTEALNEYSEDLQTNFGFSVREDLNNQIIVEIKNKETDETIKQFPPEELLTIKEKMAELVGMIFDISV